MSNTFTTTSPPTTSPVYASPLSPFKKQKMSITQTYYLAHKARAKLSHEAAMPDHNLRLLVGHANLLDSLMLELADAEREQESWFNNSVRSASQAEKKTSSPLSTESRHIQWADSIPEEEEEDDYDYSSSDDDSDISEDEEDEDVEMADVVSLRRVPSHHNKSAPPSPKMEVVEIDMEDFEEDDSYEDDEDYADLALVRSPSHHSAASPPELEHDMDESSEDESMPPSPPTALLPTFNGKQQQHHQQHQQQQQQKTSPEEDDDDDDEADLYDDSIHYMPAARNTARLVSAISVY